MNERRRVRHISLVRGRSEDGADADGADADGADDGRYVNSDLSLITLLRCRQPSAFRTRSSRSY